MNSGRLLTRAAIRELDRRAIEDWGIPSFALMESAGRACADAVLERLGDRARVAPVQVLCGPGNNGGDGLVIARTLVNRGVSAEVSFVGELERLEACSEDVQSNARLWRDLGGEIRELAGAAAIAAEAARLAAAPLLVDALFGTGLTRPLGSPWSDAVRALEASGRPVLAVDVPSGLDADTGAILGVCVRAVETVTFIAAKVGFTRGAGPEHCGVVRVAEIGVPQRFIDEAPSPPES